MVGREKEVGATLEAFRRGRVGKLSTSPLSSTPCALSGAPILRLALTQLKGAAVTGSRRDLHATLLEYLLRHLSAAAAAPHGAASGALDPRDPIASKVA